MLQVLLAEASAAVVGSQVGEDQWGGGVNLGIEANLGRWVYRACQVRMPKMPESSSLNDS